jgi:hypothetical protein
MRAQRLKKWLGLPLARSKELESEQWMYGD